MHFLTDAKLKQITAFNKKKYAARYAFSLARKPQTNNPVHDVMQLPEYGERFLILTLSDAFEAIEASDDQAAQELAYDFRRAVNEYYKEQTKR